MRVTTYNVKDLILCETILAEVSQEKLNFARWAAVQVRELFED